MFTGRWLWAAWYFMRRKSLLSPADAEVATSTGAYFRTSLYNYQKVRAQGRYQVVNSLNLAVDFTLLNNQNPTPGVNFDAKANQESPLFVLGPGGGETLGTAGVLWPFLSAVEHWLSFAAGPDAADLALHRQFPHRHGAVHRESAGSDAGRPRQRPRSRRADPSSVLREAARPVIINPLAKAMVPIAKNVNWVSEWRYYGYGEAFYLYEGFRTHLVTTGLRFTR